MKVNKKNLRYFILFLTDVSFYRKKDLNLFANYSSGKHRIKRDVLLIRQLSPTLKKRINFSSLSFLSLLGQSTEHFCVSNLYNVKAVLRSYCERTIYILFKSRQA